MTSTDKHERDLRPHSEAPILQKEHGLFNSTNLTVDPKTVYAFCQKPETIEQVTANFPLGVENFLDLELVSSSVLNESSYQVEWENKTTSKIPGHLILTLTPGPLGRGTLLKAASHFKHIHPKDDEPSTLMNMFLRRLKALVETGEIPTTRGQSSGRDELTETLH